MYNGSGSKCHRSICKISIPARLLQHNLVRGVGGLCLAFGLAHQSIIQGSFGATLPARLELTNSRADLVVGPVPASGSLFVFAAPDLTLLESAPVWLLQTNTPLTNLVRLPVSGTGASPAQAFFKVAHWAGPAPVMVDIPAGSFIMGTPPVEQEQSAWEGPQTAVTLTRAFKMGKYEVTQAQYSAVMSNNPSYYAGVSNRPVEAVNWTNAMNYCARLTADERAAGCLPAGWTYRLPTEAEWEYACRAGTTTAFAYGSALRSGMANFNGREEYDATLGTIYNPAGVSVDKPAVVGGYAPNAWGLYDMHGNVWEWCLDRWSYNLPGGSVTDPQGATTGTDRVLRGGSWYSYGRNCRSDYRSRGQAGYQGNEVGFRVVLVPPSSP